LFDTFGGGEIVDGVHDLTDRTSEDLNPTKKAAATDALVTTSCYELMFWNMDARRPADPRAVN
jgi:thiaminase